MPSGERSQTWYPELVALLRSRWRPDLAWPDVIALRDHLQAELEALRSSRGIQPPMFHCGHCGAHGPGAPPRISVRAMLISVRRFGIEPVEKMRMIEGAWARHRIEHGLDLLGRPTDVSADGHEHHDH